MAGNTFARFRISSDGGLLPTGAALDGEVEDYALRLLVAHWPGKRVGHWSSLLQARAIENQSWVIGVNRVGKDGNGFQYPGCSVVHDPMGETVAHLAAEECCRRVDLDLKMVEKVRQAFPFQADADSFKLR